MIMRIQFNSLVLFLMCSSLVAQIYVEKTGTSTIQQFLNVNRVGLLDEGILYPESPGLTNHRKLS